MVGASGAIRDEAPRQLARSRRRARRAGITRRRVLALSLVRLGERHRERSLHAVRHARGGLACQRRRQHQGLQLEDYNLDNIPPGKVLLAALRRGDRRARQGALRRGGADAARAAASSAAHLARAASGTRSVIPHQMWLDGLYMASPFLAQYAAVCSTSRRLFDDVAEADHPDGPAHLRSRHRPLLARAGTSPRPELGQPEDRRLANFWAAPSAGTRWRWWTCSTTSRSSQPEIDADRRHPASASPTAS